MSAQGKPAAEIGLPIFWHVWIFGFQRSPIPFLDRVYGLALNLLQWLACHRVDVPRLQIAARCGICCTLDQPAHDIRINILIEEVPQAMRELTASKTSMASP
jgi:hypothetical protein